MEGLTEGRIVHYVLDEGPNKGEHRPAIVVKVWQQAQATNPGYSNLLVFMDGSNDYTPLPPQEPDEHGMLFGQLISFMVWKTSVHYSEDKEPGSWHWIEKA